MSFLVLLLAVWIEKFSALRQRVQRDSLWLQELHKLESSPRTTARPWLVLALTVLLPVLLLALILWVLGSVAYGWLALPVHLLVLIYSLGRGDLLAALGPFRDACRRGDEEAAVLVAERDLGVVADDGERLLEGVQGYLLWQAYQSFFCGDLLVLPAWAGGSTGVSLAGAGGRTWQNSGTDRTRRAVASCL